MSVMETAVIASRCSWNYFDDQKQTQNTNTELWVKINARKMVTSNFSEQTRVVRKRLITSVARPIQESRRGPNSGDTR